MAVVKFLLVLHPGVLGHTSQICRTSYRSINGYSNSSFELLMLSGITGYPYQSL
ncbi:Uncharacterised protein [Klebsiella grimontii]|uniref:Uncharacterized protein n=1 Tax=Klebsiella grimontii TaxID=2058152 RepID=A0A7H4PB55_9ENTR|nr:Uncharacterised protein [Klebsiella grimontii]